MRRYIYCIVAVGIFSMLLPFSSCVPVSPAATTSPTPVSSPTPSATPVHVPPSVPTNPSKVPRITVADLKAKMDSGEKFLLVDTRFKEEYDYSHLPGAVLAEIANITSGKWIPQGSLDQEIIIYCG
jgi:hypothetical protein